MDKDFCLHCSDREIVPKGGRRKVAFLTKPKAKAISIPVILGCPAGSNRNDRA